jgi:Tfp pilus assembly protein PilO
MKTQRQTIKENLDALKDQPKLVNKEETLGGLIQKKDRLIAERNAINAQIKEVKKQISIWEKQISPNQTTMF